MTDKVAEHPWRIQISIPNIETSTVDEKQDWILVRCEVSRLKSNQKDSQTFIENFKSPAYRSFANISPR